MTLSHIKSSPLRIGMFTLIILALCFISAKEKNPELFAGESHLTSCQENIPLTYSSKTDEIVAAKAIELKDKELVLVQSDKKTKSIIYYRCYLITEKSKDGKDIFNFLVRSESYEAHKKGNFSAVFIKFREKYDRFYLAECFDKVMETHPEIKMGWTLLKG